MILPMIFIADTRNKNRCMRIKSMEIFVGEKASDTA